MRHHLAIAGLLALGVVVGALLLFSGEPGLQSAPGVERDPREESHGGEGFRAPISEGVRSEEVHAAAPEFDKPTSQAVVTAAISGVVWVKGLAPSEPLTLRLLAEGDGVGGAGVARAKVAADGTFVFEGLEPGFKGRIQLPRRYALAGSQPRQRALPVEAPSDGHALDLDRLPALTGRVVSQSSGEPVEDAAVHGILTWDDGGQALVGVDAEAGGRFYVSISETKTLQAVRLEATSPNGLRAEFEFAREHIPPDLDLGDLALEVGSVLHLEVLDPDRRAVEGARVQPRGLHARFVHTDHEGRATLTGLEPQSTVTVLARGFDPVVLEAPVSESTVAVVLERANRLTLRVLDPEGTPRAGVRVKIAAEAPPFVGTEYAPDEFLVPHIPKSGAITGQEVNRKWFCSWFVSDETGTVALQSLVPGLPLMVVVQDELDTVALEQSVPPLRAQEVRELVLRLPLEPHSLAGVVEDATGRTIARAQVTLGTEGHAALTESDAEGRFQFRGLIASEADLKVERQGYLAARLRRVPIHAHADPLRIVLEPGRDVRVRVVDEFGVTVEQGALSARLPDGDPEWRAARPQEGWRRLSDLPFQELDVRLDLAGKQFHAALGAHQEQLELLVPACGRLEVTCRGPAIAQEHISVRLRGPGSEYLEQSARFGEGANSVLFEAVLPGGYEVLCQTWRQESDRIDFVPHGEPAIVHVAAGESARVELR